MKIHELKTVNPFFESVRMKHKNFEVRKNDREEKFEVGDILVLREYIIYVVSNKEPHYTNRSVVVVITYILDDPEYCKDGYVIIGFKEIHKN